MSEAFKFSGPVESELLDELEQMAARIKAGTLLNEQVGAELKALAARLSERPAKRRGRPVGARTKADTPAVKRAREYRELLYTGTRPNAAARAVAKKWDVAESTVFKESARHDSRLVDELERETDEILHSAGLRFMELYPGVADPIFDAWRSGFDKAATDLDNAGNPVAAATLRSFAPELERFATISTGMMYLSLAR
jgi:hypothetical protein